MTCYLELPINCRKRGPVYEMNCVTCKEMLDTVEQAYRGQTGRTTYHRMKEHFAKWESGAEDSNLYKHSLESHNGARFNYTVRILARCYGKPTTRMITEAIRIEELPDENSMNEKSEWNYVQLPRVTIE